MKFVPAKCPSCNGDLQIPDDREFVKCMYCGGDIKVREVLNLKVSNDYSTELKLWKIDADKAFEKGSYEKSLALYEKILVIDPNDLNAIFSKARIQMYELFIDNYLLNLKLDLDGASDFSQFKLISLIDTDKNPIEIFNEAFEKLKYVLKCDYENYNLKISDLVLKCVESIYYKIYKTNKIEVPNSKSPNGIYSNKIPQGVSIEKDLMMALSKDAGAIGLFEVLLQITYDVSIKSEIESKIKSLCERALRGGYYAKYKKKLFGGDDILEKDYHDIPIYEPLASLFKGCMKKY